MLNFNKGAMKDKDNVVAPVVQQTYSAKYCKVRRLNHLHLVEFLTADADTEYVAMQIDQSCRHSDKLIRWGTLYRACLPAPQICQDGLARSGHACPARQETCQTARKCLEQLAALLVQPGNSKGSRQKYS